MEKMLNASCIEIAEVTDWVQNNIVSRSSSGGYAIAQAILVQTIFENRGNSP